MKTSALALLVVADLVAATARAEANDDLARARNCLSCHTIERKVVGPSLRDVATRYAGQKDGEATLAEKIIKGSKGAWGPLPMPPNATVKPDEASRLARWILTLK